MKAPEVIIIIDGRAYRWRAIVELISGKHDLFQEEQAVQPLADEVFDVDGFF